MELIIPIAGVTAVIQTTTTMAKDAKTKAFIMRQHNHHTRHQQEQTKIINAKMVKHFVTPSYSFDFFSFIQKFTF